MDEFHRQHGRTRYWTIPPKPDEKRIEHKQARQRLKRDLREKVDDLDDRNEDPAEHVDVTHLPIEQSSFAPR